MKALAVFPADRRFSVIDHPEPSLTGPSEVKLRMLDVGICGTDKEIVSFEYGTPPEGWVRDMKVEFWQFLFWALSRNS